MHTESVHTQDKRLACAREILAGAEMKMGVESTQIRAFDDGVIRRGSVYHVGRSMGKLLYALGNVMGADMWAGIVALPEVGWQAAEAYGVDLDRILIIPEPAAMEEMVLSGVVSAVDIVVCGHLNLAPSQCQRLAAAARQQRTVVLTWHAWAGVSRPLFVPLSAAGVGADNVVQFMRKAQ